MERAAKLEVDGTDKVRRKEGRHSGMKCHILQSFKGGGRVARLTV
jgi:hypothetical protein